MIFGERVEQAREFGELTQTELGTRIGVKQAAIAQIERGVVQPSEQTLALLCEQLGFPRSFFEREPLHHFGIGTLEFRARADITAKVKKRSYQYARIVFELANMMATRVKMPQMRLPRLTGDPEQAALALRSEIGLHPNTPIPNLTNALERAGVFVFSLPDLRSGCDGFSSWAAVDRRLVPAIFVSSDAPGDRERLTIAHEVGELTLLDMPPGRARERAANAFAGALLMPADALRRDLVPPLTLHDFVEVKPRYGVSIQAALVRAHQLGIITDSRYRTLYTQISSKGWRKSEPVQVPIEKPRALTKMAEVVYGLPIDVMKMAEDTGLDPIFIRHILGTHATKHDLAPQKNTAQIIEFVPRTKKLKEQAKIEEA